MASERRKAARGDVPGGHQPSHGRLVNAISRVWRCVGSISSWLNGRCAVLLVRGPRQRPNRSSTACSILTDVPLDVLQVQPPTDNLTASDLEQRHPAHLEGLPVAAGARQRRRSRSCHRPGPTGRSRRRKRGSPRHGLPVGGVWARPAKALPGCASCSLRSVLVDQTGHGIEIMRVRGRGQPVDHFGHQALPRLTAMALTCLAMVPAVAQALQRLTAAAMAYPSRPGNTAHRRMRPADRANKADVNIDLPAIHDKSSCLGGIRSCMRGRQLRADHLDLRACAALPSHSGRRA